MPEAAASPLADAVTVIVAAHRAAAVTWLAVNTVSQWAFAGRAIGGRDRDRDRDRDQGNSEVPAHGLGPAAETAGPAADRSLGQAQTGGDLAVAHPEGRCLQPAPDHLGASIRRGQTTSGIRHA
ncbi:hypothetical protein [Streptomyces goshikiensis]|uniref:hypothetical protein n=1 Tax=Streptomyces goshikiensis TaxID=1942 RepID=UPI0036DB3450